MNNPKHVVWTSDCLSLSRNEEIAMIISVECVKWRDLPIFAYVETSILYRIYHWSIRRVPKWNIRKLCNWPQDRKVENISPSLLDWKHRIILQFVQMGLKNWIFIISYKRKSSYLTFFLSAFFLVTRSFRTLDNLHVRTWQLLDFFFAIFRQSQSCLGTWTTRHVTRCPRAPFPIGTFGVLK